MLPGHRLLTAGALVAHLTACGPSARPTPAAPRLATATPTSAVVAASRSTPAPPATPTPAGAIRWAPAPAARPTAPPGSAAAGGRLFTVKGCGSCHGTYAEGNVVGPQLAGTHLSFDLVLREIRAPRHVKMPPFTPRDISDAEAADIYAFLQSLERT